MSALAELERRILALTETIMAETRALKAQDFAAAAAMAPSKRAAVEAFIAARATLSQDELRPIAADLAMVVDRLRDSLHDNRALLEQAVVVQGRVIETLAQAATRAAPSAGNYGRGGGAASPLAISVRA
jgi:hypothetical protein